MNLWSGRKKPLSRCSIQKMYEHSSEQLILRYRKSAFYKESDRYRASSIEKEFIVNKLGIIRFLNQKEGK